MKIQQLDFAITVAQEGSITKAARKLAIAQPNISSAIKELESEIGFKIFRRMPDGMELTPEGKVFVEKAQIASHAMHALQNEYSTAGARKFSLSVSFSYSAYASDALSEVLRSFCEQNLSFDFHISETSTQGVLDDIFRGKTDLGVIHLPYSYYPHIRQQLADRNLIAEIIMQFKMQILMRADHPLAALPELSMKQLADYPELLYEIENPETYHQAKISTTYDFHNGRQKIFVKDRGMQINLLKALPNAYMWVSPIPANRLEKEGLTLKSCPQATNENVDVLICRSSLVTDPQITRIREALITYGNSVME